MKGIKIFNKKITQASIFGYLSMGIVAIIIALVIVFSYWQIDNQFCKERLNTISVVSEKITHNIYNKFQYVKSNLMFAISYLDVMEEAKHEHINSRILDTEDALGYTKNDGIVFLFDDKGFYYGNQGKLGKWADQDFLQLNSKGSITINNLPTYGEEDYLLFFYKFKKPHMMDGIKVTHIALARKMSILDFDLDIGKYGDVDNSYVIKKNGVGVYSQSKNEVFVNVYNILTALEEAEFDHGDSYSDIKTNIKNNKSGSTHIKYKGSEYMIAYQPIGIEDWYALYIVCHDTMSTSTREFIVQTVVIVCVAASILLLVFIVVLLLNNKEWRKKENIIREKLRIAAEESKKANMAKSEFLSHMSHDIRTPVNGIVGMTHIAKKNLHDNVQVGECLSKISNCSKHLVLLINDVLDMSRIESGALTLKNEAFSIEQTLKECSDVIEGRLYDRKVNYIPQFEGISSEYIEGDENYLKQILINILGNAVKFTPDGGTISFKVTREETKDNKSLYKFVISDTGIGMSEAFLKNIFEPFAQEEDGARTRYKGTGLGMAIVKKLIDKMNGNISVTSVRDKGSTFTFQIPFNKANKVEEVIVEEETQEIKIDGKVLLVEDNDLNREIAEFLLEDYGIEYDSVEDGSKAVELFADSEIGEYKAILMDIRMPIMNGYEATKTIRSMDREDADSVVIIAMTADAYAEDEKRSMSNGMNGHISKPIDMNKFINTMKLCTESA
ncbi:MAG: response regulator [Lachnospiraceae bacterium]|nr:response regulator [Lachnospiraceae bacterium]